MPENLTEKQRQAVLNKRTNEREARKRKTPGVKRNVLGESLEPEGTITKGGKTHTVKRAAPSVAPRPGTGNHPLSR